MRRLPVETLKELRKAAPADIGRAAYCPFPNDHIKVSAAGFHEEGGTDMLIM